MLFVCDLLTSVMTNQVILTWSKFVSLQLILTDMLNTYRKLITNLNRQSRCYRGFSARFLVVTSMTCVICICLVKGASKLQKPVDNKDNQSDANLLAYSKVFQQLLIDLFLRPKKPNEEAKFTLADLCSRMYMPALYNII